jgi:broad specificity phosphatase PhoE
MSGVATIYLIRHGETASNVEGRFRGRADIPLSENGFRQAEALGLAFRDIELSAIYSSPLIRAMQTAEAVAKGRKTPIIEHESFLNIDLGDWTGKPRAEIEAKYPELWQKWRTVPEDMVIPGGEGVMDVMRRSLDGLNALAAKHMGEKIAVVSHRAVLKPLIAGALGILKPFFWKLHLDTAGWSMLRSSQGSFTLVHMNIINHIENVTVEVV